VTATVYKARIEDGSVVVDWLIVGSLDQLAEALADGWVTSEAVARAGALAVGPQDAPEPVAAPQPVAEPEPVADPEPEPEPDAPKPTARKKK
jgi:hypothetical protein